MVNSIILNFNNGNGNYTVLPATPSMPQILNVNADQTFEMPVNVLPSAVAGQDTFFATLNITESVGGSNYNVSDPSIYDNWLVQLRPNVLIDSVITEPDVASTGQTNIRGLVYLRNEDTANRADAQVDSLRLTISQGGEDESDQFLITRTNTPALPQILKAGNTTQFEFNINVDDTTHSGDYDPMAIVYSKDLNDDSLFITPEPLSGSTFTVQNQALLIVDTIWSEPDTISLAQDHSRIKVLLGNSGQAPAIINSSEISFDKGGSEFDPVLRSHSTPFNLNGGESDTLVYSIGSVQTVLGYVQVTADISGEDQNSGAG